MPKAIDSDRAEIREQIIKKIDKLQPGKGGNRLTVEIDQWFDKLERIAERVPAHTRWPGLAAKAKAAQKALIPLIKRLQSLNNELIKDDEKYKKEKKSGPTNPKFYKSEIKNLEKLKAKLARHATLTTGRDPRIPELKYKCANAAYSLMSEYSQKEPSHTPDGRFQIIARKFFEGTATKGDGHEVSMVRACNRVLRELA